MVAPRVAGRAGVGRLLTEMPLVSMTGTRELRYTYVFEMAPSSVTLVTGPMRDTMPSEVVGKLGLLTEGGVTGMHGDEVAELVQLLEEADF